MTYRSRLSPSAHCVRPPPLQEESVTRLRLHQTSKRTGVFLAELECANEGATRPRLRARLGLPRTAAHRRLLTALC